MQLKLKILILILISASIANADATSCKSQLKNHEWPIDCLLGLKISGVKASHLHYQNLDTWCAINSELLYKKIPAKIFVTLSPPSTCLKIANDRLDQQKALNIIRGDFLNSFL